MGPKARGRLPDVWNAAKEVAEGGTILGNINLHLGICACSATPRGARRNLMTRAFRLVGAIGPRCPVIYGSRIIEGVTDRHRPNVQHSSSMECVRNCPDRKTRLRARSGRRPKILRNLPKVFGLLFPVIGLFRNCCIAVRPQTTNPRTPKLRDSNP